MPRGAKTSKTCSLDTMKVDKTVSIFKVKHMKGWWPFAVNTGEISIDTLFNKEFLLDALTLNKV